MHEPSAAARPCAARWLDGPAIVNLRGRPDEPGFLQAAASALGLALPTEPCRTVEGGGLRLLWAGPDDWFLIRPGGRAEALVAGLRSMLAGHHVAITDVSSGYAVLQLAGPGATEVLARGCPLDLHPRVFSAGHCAGTHFFKASVWLWRPGEEALFELLVRRSFAPYVGLMLERPAPLRPLVAGAQLTAW